MQADATQVLMYKTNLYNLAFALIEIDIKTAPLHLFVTQSVSLSIAFNEILTDLSNRI